MPRFSIIYVKRTEKTPKTTTITFIFPDGQTVDYKSDNVILEDLTKEIIIEKKLFLYIPFYIARYEKDIASDGNIERAIESLAYFRDEMERIHQAGELTDDELIDLKGFVNTIVTHITNGNKNEERLVNIMGGTVIETESDKIKIRLIIELGQEDGLDDEAILKRLQEKIIGLPLNRAETYMKQYGKQLV
ncbi:MAG: hypothetical protein NC434_15725 [Ruminococcus sp.]|nr:hypothetical protein [Ruminococcus sp.]